MSSNIKRITLKILDKDRNVIKVILDQHVNFVVESDQQLAIEVRETDTINNMKTRHYSISVDDFLLVNDLKALDKGTMDKIHALMRLAK